MLNQPQEKKKPHIWRKCPLGEYWRGPHQRKGTKGVRGHCVTNPSRKDQIYQEELEIIAKNNFSKLEGPPKNDNLDNPNGNKFDHLIRGWTKYWNEIFQTNIPLDPNLVKALILTESSFNIKAGANAGRAEGRARGLMQITDLTIKILKDENGELRNHLVNVNQKDMINPNLNLAAGIRWLFRKKETASSKLEKEADWIWTIADYKGYFREFKKNPEHKQMKRLIETYERLKK